MSNCRSESCLSKQHYTGSGLRAVVCKTLKIGVTVSWSTVRHAHVQNVPSSFPISKRAHDAHRQLLEISCIADLTKAIEAVNLLVLIHSAPFCCCYLHINIVCEHNIYTSACWPIHRNTCPPAPLTAMTSQTIARPYVVQVSLTFWRLRERQCLSYLPNTLDPCQQTQAWEASGLAASLSLD